MNPIDAVKRMVLNVVNRAVVRLVNDDLKMQAMQIEVLRGEVRQAVERFQNYGFTSVPMKGAEAVVLFPGGLREQGLIIAVDDRRYRLKGLEAGEVAIYTDEGDYVHLKRNNQMVLHSESKIIFDTPLAEVSGDLHVIGTMTADTDAVIADITFTTHIHSGVQGGAGNTGAPVP